MKRWTLRGLVIDFITIFVVFTLGLLFIGGLREALAAHPTEPEIQLWSGPRLKLKECEELYVIDGKFVVKYYPAVLCSMRGWSIEGATAQRWMF